MPSLSRSLEQALHRAIKLASDRHHEYATLEHLLLALTDDADAVQVMKACNVDTEALRRGIEERDAATLRALYAAAGEPKELWMVPGATHGKCRESAGAQYDRRVMDFFLKSL